MHSPLISVVILNYNGAPFLERCLRSLEKQSYPHVEVIVFDNASPDQSIEILQRAEFSWVRVIASSENLYFARGYNAAIHHASGDVLFILNNDTWVHPNCLENIVKALDDRVGAYAPRQMDYEGKTILEEGVAVDKFGFPFQDRRAPIFYAEGSGLVIRKDLFEYMGGFDEKMVMIFEDNDLCWRLQLQGYEIRPIPDAIFYHFGGATIGGAAATGNLSKGTYRTSVMKRYYGERNQLRTLLKNYSATSLLRILPQWFFWKMVEIGYWAVRLRFDILFRIYLLSFLANVRLLPNTIRTRKEIQRNRKVSDSVIRERMVPGNAKLEMFRRIGQPQIPTL